MLMILAVRKHLWSPTRTPCRLHYSGQAHHWHPSTRPTPLLNSRFLGDVWSTPRSSLLMWWWMEPSPPLHLPPRVLNPTQDTSTQSTRPNSVHGQNSPHLPPEKPSPAGNCLIHPYSLLQGQPQAQHSPLATLSPFSFSLLVLTILPLNFYDVPCLAVDSLRGLCLCAYRRRAGALTQDLVG